MKKKITICICLFLAAGAAFGAREKTRHSITFSAKGLSFLNVAVSRDSSGSDIFRLKDISYERNADPFLNDIVLSLRGSASSKNYDDTGRYRIDYASYESARGGGNSGGNAALFYRQEDRVEIAPGENLWLSSPKDLGSFTIEMRVNPLALREGSILFSRVGYVSGVKNGIEIRVTGGRVCAFFYGIFADENGSRIDVSMHRGVRLQEKRWQHYALSYDRLTGKLSQLLDGRECEALFVTETGQAGEGVYRPSFAAGDAPFTVIGKNYSGYIDEFRISYRHFADLKDASDTADTRYRNLRVNGRVPANREGIITSNVEEFPYTGTKVNLFSWDADTRGDSFVRFEFRISDTEFMRQDSAVKWYRIDNSQRNISAMNTPDGLLRGKYYQWRARLIASPDGAATPELKNIRMNYELDIAPDVPASPEVVKAEDGSVTLRWQKNSDFDLAGYKLYYGVLPGRYDGVIRIARGRRIDNTLTDGNYITLTVDNSLIEENRSIDGGHVLEYPVIKNNILYYFALSAYDSYKPDTKFNHESKLSSAARGRPVDGTEI
ncbi:MAG: LamG-like jellyroll fold domain-containing protein, partial [Spirochaetota bacterium]